MPQLDFSTYLGQVFWLLLSFATLYLFVQYWFFPRMVMALQIREEKINSLILEAQRLKEKTSQLEDKYLTELNDFHHQLKQISAEADSSCKSYSDASMKVLEQELTNSKNKLTKSLDKWQNDVELSMEDISLMLSKALLAAVVGSGIETGAGAKKVDLIKYYNKIKDE